MKFGALFTFIYAILISFFTPTMLSSKDEISPYRKRIAFKNNKKEQAQKRNAGLEYLTLRSKKIIPGKPKPENMVSYCEYSKLEEI